ncbi:wall-associated receptor kinase-like 14 [Silene latifolia]|uniref:wall-associated receptor kinase-like 14 n=1 Tax=Silene latifolia TaxID=37657 RepID=UPI003D7816DF
MSIFAIYLLFLTFTLLEDQPKAVNGACDGACGGVTVNYPFGFGSGCKFQINCTKDGKMEFKGYSIRNITWDAIWISLPTKCNRSVEQLRSLFGENYALTSQNGLVLQNCSTKTTSSNGAGCVVSPKSVETMFGVENCVSNSSDVNVNCFPSTGNDSKVLRYEDIGNLGCKYVLSSMIVLGGGGGGGGNGSDDGGVGSDVSIEFQAVQVRWWITGTCRCDPNAVCGTVGSDGFGCMCNAGFVGDGFLDGHGCRNATDADLETAHGVTGKFKIAVLIGGILAGAASTLILATICYFCRRRSTYMKSQVSARRLLFEAAGNSTVRLYAYREIERATGNFCEKQLLGTGAYGAVYAGRLHHNEDVAIKKIKHRDTDSIEQVMNEIKLLSTVSHPNLVRLLGCCIENGEQILVYEFMPNGTLSQHLQRERGKGLPWTIRLAIASETAQAISYLHSAMNPPIFHRDIKSSNILLDFDYRSKVADFGLSRLGLEEMSHISTAPQGTPGYVDPQYHQNFHLSDKSDVYSFGVVLVEIITAMRVVDFTRPHLEVNLAALAVDRIGKGRIDEIIDPFIELHRDAWTLASVHKVAELAFRCLAYHRDMRPSMMEVAHELEQIRQSGWVSIEENICMGSSVASSYSSPFNGSERSFSGISTKKAVGSQRLILPQKPSDHLSSLEEVQDGSPVSVHDAWFSEQSSPSTNSLLGNIITR